MSHRKNQVESTLKRLIADVLARRICDPRILGMVSVTRVDVSPDLRHASVYVSVLPQRYQVRTVHGLRHAAKYIHSLLYKAVKMRSVPKLDFRLDESIKKQDQVLDAIEQARAEHPWPNEPLDTAAQTDGSSPMANKEQRQ